MDRLETSALQDPAQEDFFELSGQTPGRALPRTDKQRGFCRKLGSKV